MKLLAMRSAGYNNVDMKHAKEKNLPVVRVPDYSPYSVAEYAVALMLTVGRNIHKAYNRTREHDFSLANLTGFEYHGKTVGIIGEGMIGKCVISICKGMGMNVIVNTPHPHNIEGVEYVSLDELYRRSDIIQLHCPLTEENVHMINDEAIAKMKPGSDNGMANYDYYVRQFGPLDQLEASDNNPETLVRKLKAAGKKIPDIYMACGTEDFLLSANREMHRFLQKEKVPHEYHEAPGNHNSAFWAEHIAYIVKWMFEKK